MKRWKATATVLTIAVMGLVGFGAVAGPAKAAPPLPRLVVWCMAASGWEGWGEAGGLCSAITSTEAQCEVCCEDEAACNNIIAALLFLVGGVPLPHGSNNGAGYLIGSEYKACLSNCMTDVNDYGGGNNGSNGGNGGGNHGG